MRNSRVLKLNMNEELILFSVEKDTVVIGLAGGTGMLLITPKWRCLRVPWSVSGCILQVG